MTLSNWNGTIIGPQGVILNHSFKLSHL